MDYRLNNVNGVEHGAYECAHHSAAEKVAQRPLPENCLVHWHEAPHFVSQAKEHERARAVAEKNGYQSPVVLPDAVRRQEFEGIHRVLEAVMMFLVLQQGLNPFQRSEYGLCGASHEASKELHGKIARLREMMNREATITAERSEHDGDRYGLLDKRRQATAVEVAETFTTQLVQGVVGSHTVQHLPKHHFVHWKSADYVYEGSTPTTDESAHVIVSRGDVVGGVPSLLKGNGSHSGVDVAQTATMNGVGYFHIAAAADAQSLAKAAESVRASRN